MINWLDKYKPKKSSDVLGDKHKISYIQFFLKQFTKKNSEIQCPNLIITGENGIGKTLMVDLLIQENNFEKVTADLSNISITRKSKKKKKTEKETIGPNRSVKTYYTTLHNKSISLMGDLVKKNIVVVFDDVSNISNNKEKEAIKSIIKINNKEKKFPIIVISNTKHSKTVNELKKMVTFTVKKTNQQGKKENKKTNNEIVIKPPPYNDIKKFIMMICNNENLKLKQRNSDDNDIYRVLISHCQNDIRRLINILEELKSIHGNNDITMDKLDKYREISKEKDIDPGIYKATGILLNDYVNITGALSLYEEERATIPLMVHENYPSNIQQQYPKMSIEDQINVIYQISESISESDKIDGLIYSNQCWSLQPVHGFYSCVLPSYYINKNPDKLSMVEVYKYTQDYNKTSIKKINNKVIKKAQENQYLKKVSIYDFLYMASILKTLFENKDLETVAKIMKPYGLKLKEIENIIKIDKVKKTKTTLTGKQRTELKKLLGVDE
ncbi:replication factor C large subunit [Cotonvirus japonicus]|uniref:Replication factor C large subunit n=1 Tax=Cotonvirus japonicus TaxID=2811091 RepID=A0ABM7NSJ6_9VIRU|nr:replication factor C large subunit [Cotonvirus japonicus]BCS83140.1 replication factor C large subunit [Cotonvirus japonicus]